MSITISTGAIIAIAKTYGASVTMSALSNASQAVATLAGGHGVSVGDYLEVTSGWGLLDKRIVRVDAVSTNDITFEDIDTSNTTKYPSGSGIGSIRRITAWTNLSQIKNISTSGGDLQFADVTAIDDVVSKQIPTVRSAVSMTIDAYDDPTLTWYADVKTATDARIPYGMRMTTPNGAKTVANTYWSMSPVPTVATNDAVMTSISLSYAAEPVRYAT